MPPRRTRRGHHRHGAFENFQERVETQVHISRGEQSRECVGGAARAPVGRFGIDQPVGELHASLILATTLEAAATRSPSRTVTVHSGPKKMSTREPNVMSPIRSPLSTTSPGFL